MPKITLQNGEIANFQGDAIICPSDVDLTNKRSNKWIYSILDKAGSDLTRELSAIGYCETGNAVITKAYDLKVKHLIFLPILYQDDKEHKLNFVLFHKALRSAFNLAILYDIKTLAIPLLSLRFSKEDFFNKLVKSLFEIKPKKGLTNEEIMNIIIAVSGEYKNTSLETITIYG